jgi:hypothetical protein
MHGVSMKQIRNLTLELQGLSQGQSLGTRPVSAVITSVAFAYVSLVDDSRRI